MSLSPDYSDLEGFHVVSFAIDGSLEGLGRWDKQNLSPKWATTCNDLFEAKGCDFDYNWGGTLSHIRTKLTSARGAAICTLFVYNQAAALILLMRGDNAAAECDGSKLFVGSLQKMFQADAGLSDPFSGVLSMSERPLMVVVPVPAESVSEQDHDVIRELSLHLAYAFLGRSG